MNPDWLAPGREQFFRLSKHLPHALLIHGEPGTGKHILGIEMVASLLCEQSRVSDGIRSACGQCKNCIMFASENHPDFHFISSEQLVESGKLSHLVYADRYLQAAEKRGKRKPRKVISVDQIRALIEDFSLSSHSAANKVAMIEPADAMNVNASNALLKLLEEPSPGSVLILVCHDISRLPMTIRSRCIALPLAAPAFKLSLDWLKSQGVNEGNAHKALAICGGAPLLALAYTRSDQITHFETLLDCLVAILEQHANAVESREKLLKLQTPPVLLSWLQMVINWLIRALRVDAQKGEQPWQAYHRDFASLSRRVDQGNLPALFELYDDLLVVKNQDVDLVNFGLLLDKWLIAFEQRLA